MNLFANRLREWRRHRHIPLKQMAADLGVSIAVVSAWENGNRFPTAEHFEQLADYTGMPAWQLIYDGPDDGSSNPRQRD